ncbi:hypothetical protein BDN71DRAFT_1404502 [Pleurotus eryngii]|uniref:Uncharacterized protein n=1 Tax=Pleurotus eryngii TaxID=5323 RepID=A0A9P6D9D1_PLEER|nr:hypothetical protein BDN71DRAFT_1404502 [Pleurotus eryngii]
MRHECIQSTPCWRKGGERHDCAFIVEDQDLLGFKGMSVVRVQLLFSFIHDSTTIPCAFVEWFQQYSQRPDPDTGMWIVRPETSGHHDTPVLSVIHLDSLLWLAHLLPIFASTSLPYNFSHVDSLDAFRAFYINKYIDHHTFELLSLE